ncbi:hypothetical protein CI610_03679 [invertebrate metagenome]|uniref:Uncharacterized protein n=1 Tax=invertebrate metagenome TaxID=1711999 RepID=A0A2H9T2G5_9ZZZZ
MHQSKFKKTGNIPFPWVVDILERLDHLLMTPAEELDILTFTSCIALLQNGWYVNYKNLTKFESQLPITQVVMQHLEILSCFRLRGLIGMTLFRLHEEITFRYSEEKIQEMHDDDSSEAEECDRVPSNEENEDIFVQENVERLPVIHHNARYKAAWSTDEETILLKIINDYRLKYTEIRQWKMLYRTYLAMCAEQMTPDRTFHAFRSACLRRIKE